MGTTPSQFVEIDVFWCNLPTPRNILYRLAAELVLCNQATYSLYIYINAGSTKASMSESTHPCLRPIVTSKGSLHTPALCMALPGRLPADLSVLSAPDSPAIFPGPQCHTLFLYNNKGRYLAAITDSTFVVCKLKTQFSTCLAPINCTKIGRACLLLYDPY